MLHPSLLAIRLGCLGRRCGGRYLGRVSSVSGIVGIWPGSDLPVKIIALLGEQAAAAWKSVNRNPLLASLSRLGVLISPPKQPRSEKPAEPRSYSG